MVKPLLFNGDSEKIVVFVMAYKLYIRIRMREELVEEQVYQILIYIQRDIVDIQKKNVLVYLESEDWEFLSTGELLTVLKKEFGEGENKFVKVVELKQLEQNIHTIDEFVQIFRRVAKRSGYERRALVNKFKMEINSMIK